MTAEWYYVGHYGQLGPLTLEDVESLIHDEVILRDTMVWKPGMANWQPAIQMVDLAALFIPANPTTPPAFIPGHTPPGMPPGSPPPFMPPVASAEFPSGASASNFGAAPNWNAPGYGYPAPTYVQVHNYSNGMSDRSRVLAGILQLLIPGVGRMYLGYSAIGVIQLLLSPCGVGVVWSFIDGIIILAGGVRLDGYGRTLNP
jgi:TM2 domain-containing membrane protein YozV